MEPDEILRKPHASNVGRASILALGVCLAVVVAPLWLVDFPGMVHYPNHLVRCYVLAHYHNNPQWQQQYRVVYQPIPNLAIDLIVAPLSKVMPLLLAGKIFLSITAALYVLGCVVLGGAIAGRFNWLSLPLALTFYNGALITGLVNYEFGIGIFLLSFAFWLKSRDQMTPLRFAACCACSVAAYLSHLTSVVILGLSVLTVATLELRRNHELRRFVGNVAWLVCPAVMMLAFMGGEGRLGTIQWTSARYKLLYLLAPIRSYSNILDIILIAVLVCSAIVLARGCKINREVCAVVLLLLVLFLITPNSLFTSSGADMRYVLPAFLLFVLSVDVDLKGARRTVLIGLIVAMVVRTAVVANTWRLIDTRSRIVLSMGNRLMRGARVFVLQETSAQVQAKRIDRGFAHVIQFWTIRHQEHLNTTFAIAGQQPLVFREPPCTMLTPACVRNYDYVWSHGPPPAAEQMLEQLATPAQRWQDVTIWIVRH